MLPVGYALRRGGWGDRSLLRKVLQLTYRELFPDLQNFSPLGEAVEGLFSNATPLWWVDAPTEPSIACLWLGRAVDQSLGERYSQILLLYVVPEHRCLGVGKALIHQAEAWAKEQGDRQIGLQVFVDNHKAINLYQNLGYKTQSLLMIKSLVVQDKGYNL
jgi:ribosomal protein S18 acetylase RimI-like enzyme